MRTKEKLKTRLDEIDDRVEKLIAHSASERSAQGSRINYLKEILLLEKIRTIYVDEIRAIEAEESQ